MSTTAYHLYQECKEHFPDLNFTYFSNRLNRIVKQFIQDTECTRIVIVGSLTSGSNDITISSPASQTLTDQGTEDAMWYAFPNYVYAIDDIRYMTTDGTYLDSPVFPVISDNRIEFYDTDGQALSEWPSEIAYVEFHGLKSPSAISAVTDTVDVPDQFVDALVARILMDLYAQGKGALLQLAGWWRAEYLRLRLEAKKYGISQRDMTERRGAVGELMAADSATSQIFGSESTGISVNDGGTF